ncbi:citryl-CoA lyase [Pseudonocardia acaciae]|uniref:citryl-CoA lyase n=1 Tax=Pseudonocardia acaciae TaxID=551276 RepID=UPI0009FD502F|nr:citryl-CoA lyase [Pseudonocardia acaciae]
MTTLYASLARTAAEWPERPALVDCAEPANGATQTYRELLADVDALAGGLRELGFDRGDAIAVWLPNCLPWPRLLFAAAKLGVLVVPLNTRYRPKELYHLLATSQAKALVYAPKFETVDFGSRLEEVWAAGGELPLRWLVTVGQDKRAERAGAPDWLTTVPLTELHRSATPELAEPGDPLVVFGTSGTTSAPKLAVHTHASIGAHMPAVARAIGLGPDQTQLCVLPLGGVFGFVPFVAGILGGTPSVLLPVFDSARVRDALARHRATFMTCAEGPLRELLADPSLAEAGGHLAKTVTGGVAIDDIVAAAAPHGISAMNVYGSSEVLAYAATWSFDASPEQRTVPGGRLVAPGFQVRVMSAEDPSRPSAEGEYGELQFRGPTVFAGYLANEAATAKAFTSDGWYRSGDFGLELPDEGAGQAFQFRSRLDDKLRLRGYLVNPSDIETALHEHPAVDMAQLVGVRDQHTGDHLPVAFVRLVPGGSATADELLEHCRARLASFKVPDLVEIVAAFPTTPSANGDKVRKEELRRKAATLLTEKAQTSKPAPEVRSDIALATTDRVSVHGIDLPNDILGKVNVGDFAYLELFRRLPSQSESVVFNALVVALIEHGLTPNALASRLTYQGAPESLQGAVAAGLLGLGNRFVGTMEGAARLCQEHADEPGWRDDPAQLDQLAEKIVAEHAEAGRFVPGIGHGLHKPVDPRAERLFEIANEQGLDPANEKLIRAISAAAQRRSGKVLPVNVTGAIGAIASTLGVPWAVVRGLGVMARAIGLVGHLLEERERPLALNVWAEAERKSMAHLRHPERP